MVPPAHCGTALPSGVTGRGVGDLGGGTEKLSACLFRFSANGRLQAKMALLDRQRVLPSNPSHGSREWEEASEAGNSRILPVALPKKRLGRACPLLIDDQVGGKFPGVGGPRDGVQARDKPGKWE